MTAAQFGEVDIDLLADYVGGVLDGTPDETRVARLVAEEPAWAAAYAMLVPAVDAVRGSLADWGAQPATMPSDVADRLATALAAAGPVPQPRGDNPLERIDRSANADPLVDALARVDTPAEADASRLTEPPPRATSNDPSGRAPRHLTAVPDLPEAEDAADRPTGRAGARRRWWSRRAGPVTVAAAVVAIGGFGVSLLLGEAHSNDTETTAASDAGSSGQRPSSASGPPQAMLEPNVMRTIVSGTDYTPDTLVTRLNTLALPAASAGRSDGGPAAAGQDDHALSSAALQRLVDRSALVACLGAIAAEHGDGPLTASVVDYAMFNGAPALVVAFTDGSGAHWAWAGGSDCGLPGSGADTRYVTRVG